MLPTTKTLLVINPEAGHGKAFKIFERLEPRLRQLFPSLTIRLSEYAGHAVEIGRWAAQEAFELLLCLGGDGTPYEVVNGLYTEGRPARRPDLGLIPAGTGNSFLRDFGVDSPEIAIDRILQGRKRPVDLVEFTYLQGASIERRYSLNIIGAGLIADILKLTNEKLKPLGTLGYSLAVLLRLAKGMDNRITITADGAVQEIRDSALVVSNSKYTGGKMKIAPDADTADGKADLIVFRQVNRREILAIFKRVFAGTHKAHPKVETLQASEITVESDPPLLLMADGELLGTTPLRLKVLPGELTLRA
jgi:YegS/Rv2252/BmrU family lipid kinase